MTDEYVSRSEVHEALLNMMCGTGYQSDALSALRMCKNKEVEPVFYATWENERCINHKMWVANCSACGAENKDERPHGVSEFHRYCHWCGAKMRKEDE